MFRISSWLPYVATLVLITTGVTSDDSTAPHCGPSSRYVVAYYQTWKRQSLMNVDWSSISHLNVAYGIPTDSGDFTFDGEWFLPKLVQDAHNEKTKISLSLGGWTGSNRMSNIMRDIHKRASLIKSIGAFVEKYELDGVDIDWEYVGKQGSKCNKFLPKEDAGNFMRFLRALRASFKTKFADSEKLISLAVPVQPFEGIEGPMKDMSPFAEYVDFASILAFDINGHWSNATGPSAPLKFQKNRGSPHSFAQAINEWLDAKWPAEKLVAGVSFQGHSLTTRDVLTAKDGTEMYVPFDKDIPQGDPEDSLWYDVCENTNALSGVWQYKHLRDQGILKTTNTTSDEWIRVWDDKSSTPWLYNPQMRRLISYDDPDSIAKKVGYAKEKKLKGVMAWSLHSDYNKELLHVVKDIGPLCRGPRSDSDQPTSSSASSSSTSSSTTTTWSPPAAFASLPSQISPTTTTSLSSTTSSSSSTFESSTSPAPETTTSSLSSSTSVSSGKAIMFDEVGAPYLVVDGISSPLPSELAENIMKVGEKTTASSSSGSTSPSDSAEPMPLGPVAIPVTDSSSSKHGLVPAHPTPHPLWSAANDSFDLMSNDSSSKKTSKASSQSSNEGSDGISLDPIGSNASSSTNGFAATFFLALDASSQTSGLQTTTVVPLMQMIESAKSEASANINSLESESPTGSASSSSSSSL